MADFYVIDEINLYPKDQNNDYFEITSNDDLNAFYSFKDYKIGYIHLTLISLSGVAASFCWEFPNDHGECFHIELDHYGSSSMNMTIPFSAIDDSSLKMYLNVKEKIKKDNGIG